MDEGKAVGDKPAKSMGRNPKGQDSESGTPLLLRCPYKWIFCKADFLNYYLKVLSQNDLFY